jgi:hypothetical protein
MGVAVRETGQKQWWLWWVSGEMPKLLLRTWPTQLFAGRERKKKPITI